MARWQDLTNEQLITLPTNRLYTVYSLMQKRRGYLRYDNDVRGCENNGFDEIDTKCDFVKAELNTRGHIERKDSDVGHTIPTYNPHWVKPKIHVGPIKDPDECIGKQVFKRSKKLFKSKQFYNTVKAITTNPHTKLVAFSFEEDSSIVDIHQCNLRENKK